MKIRRWAGFISAVVIIQMCFFATLLPARSGIAVKVTNDTIGFFSEIDIDKGVEIVISENKKEIKVLFDDKIIRKVNKGAFVEIVHPQITHKVKGITFVVVQIIDIGFREPLWMNLIDLKKEVI